MKKPAYKPEIFARRCCFNCWHHLAYESSGPNAGTVVCPFRARKEYKTVDGRTYIGVDYSKRIPASHVPCSRYRIDTNLPKGCHHAFLDRKEPQQLSLF